MAGLTGIVAASLALGLPAIPAVAPARELPAASQRVVRATPAVERWRPIIAEAAQRFGIPQAWIAAVMEAESAGLTHLNHRPITSTAGAMGLMQVMPGTWAELRRQHGLGPDPHDPRDNILAGTAYLRVLYDRFGPPGLFAAYNAGPARYAEYLRTGRALPAETRSYIAQLVRTAVAASMLPPQPFQRSYRSPESWTDSPATRSGTRLFFPLGGGQKSPSRRADATSEMPATVRLFVPLQAPSGRER